MDRRTNEIETVIVDTDAGKLAGLRTGDVLSFRGVPFATPPLGPLRWRMAEPCSPWTGIRDATRIGFVCTQVVSQVEAFTGGMMGAQSEDCLFLNIWTPGCDSAKRPVMVWIHGGGFVTGAGSQRTAMLQAYDEGSPFERFNAIMTDKTFAVPMVRLLNAQAREAPQFAYRFDWRSPLLGGIMGSCHALELGFVFGTHGQKLARSFFGSGPVVEALSTTMMDCWTTFARTGNPSTVATGAWPHYNEARDVMILGDGPPHIVRAPNAERLRVWDDFPERKIGI